jgi:hypothetical protein
LASLLVVIGTLVAVPAANAATVAVDDDHAQCPAAQFASIQAAVNAVSPGDTVAVCPGRYVEGNGAPGTNALTITKSLTIKGAGADVVVIQPRRSTPTGGQIAEGRMDIRNGVGDIVSIQGGTAVPITVDISGVTVDGNGVFSEAGVVFLDAQGSMVRDRVTNVVTSISNGADDIPGGYRSNNFGYGIAQVTAADSRPAGSAPRTLMIDHTRVDRYNKIGILIDGATSGALPLNPSGVLNNGVLVGAQVIGRVQCRTFNTPTPPPYILGGVGRTPVLELPGNCDIVRPTAVGPTFGQDGVRVTAGSTVTIVDSTIAQNLVSGTGAPVFSDVEERRNANNQIVEVKEKPSSVNNGNLSLGAGVRLIGAGISSITKTNVTDNAYGVFNVGLDGATANEATPVAASGNWWGLKVTQDKTGFVAVTPPALRTNNGPAISPTVNPFYQENPVNGAPTADGAGTTSTAVDFFPFRNGNQADPDAGQLPVVYAPLPVNDSGPTIRLSTDKDNYDRGEQVHLTAVAGDDFGVTSISFFDGNALVSRVTPPADSASFAIPADALCDARSLTAVAADYLGQTASDIVEINVVGPSQCREPEPPVDPPVDPPVQPPGAPSVKLANVPAEIGQAGATVSADPSADAARGAAVAKVDFYLGSRLLCTATQAPYNCQVMPLGREAGAQALRAVVTDSGAQTAAADAAVTVSRFQPSDFTVKLSAKPASKKKIARVVSGAVLLPERVSPAEGCGTGTVSVTVKRNGATVFPLTQVPLASDCTYKLKFTVPKLRKNTFLATARFGGNAVLQPVSDNRRSH